MAAEAALECNKKAAGAELAAACELVKPYKDNSLEAKSIGDNCRTADNFVTKVLVAAGVVDNGNNQSVDLLPFT